MPYIAPEEGYIRWHVDISRDIARRANARYVELDVSRQEYVEAALELFNRLPMVDVKEELGLEELEEEEPFELAPAPEHAPERERVTMPAPEEQPKAKTGRKK